MTPGDKAGVVAVTGATGFIGRYLCDHFRRQGWEVRALVRNPAHYPFTEAGIRGYRCDLPDVIEGEALRGADVVVHCAYVTVFTNRAEAERVNDRGTRVLLERSRAAGVRRFVFLSSQAAHEGARSYYGQSKYALEQLLLGESQLVIRPGFVLGGAGEGLFHRLCETIRKARVLPLFGGGRQPFQTVHVEDLCAGIGAALARDLTGLYRVAEPRPITMGEFFRMVAARLGRRPLFVPCPLTPALFALRAVEWLRIPFPVSSENLLGLAGARAMPTGDDLAALGVEVRSVAESLDAIFPGRPREEAAAAAAGSPAR